MNLTIQHRLLSDSPYSQENKGLFISDNPDLSDLLQDIKHGTPTCYLISGYRGSGKSSFVKKIEEDIAIASTENQIAPKEIVFVYTYFSKYNNQTHLLRKLIRGLYWQLKDKDSFKEMKSDKRRVESDHQLAVLLEELYEKTFYEISRTKLTTQKKERVLIYNIDILQGLKFILSLLLCIFCILNIWFSLISLVNLFNWIGIIVFSVTGISNFFKITQNKTRSRTEQEDFNRKSLYDDEIADYHFYYLLREFGKYYKIVFVFDELDKVPDENMDQLLNEMKPYLLSGAATFIVVSGQDLFYKYSTAKSEDDALLASIFSKNIHISLLSREEFQLIFYQLLVQDIKSHTEEERKKINAYIDYFVYRSKRIPRIFINLIRNEIQWNKGEAFLETDDQENEIYSEILSAIDDVDNSDISVEGFEPAVKDFFSHAIVSKKSSNVILKTYCLFLK